ncbi:KH domain-containing protein [Tanacetum coccineum]
MPLNSGAIAFLAILRALYAYFEPRFLCLIMFISDMSRREPLHKKLSSSALEMLVPSHTVGKVMGRGRANVDNIHKISGASVEICDTKSSCGDRMAVISGTPEKKYTEFTPNSRRYPFIWIQSCIGQLADYYLVSYSIEQRPFGVQHGNMAAGPRASTGAEGRVQERVKLKDRSVFEAGQCTLTVELTQKCQAKPGIKARDRHNFESGDDDEDDLSENFIAKTCQKMIPVHRVLGMTPNRLVRHTVGLIPTNELALEGYRIHPSVSVASDTVAMFVATDIADPVLKLHPSNVTTYSLLILPMWDKPSQLNITGWLYLSNTSSTLILDDQEIPKIKQLKYDSSGAEFSKELSPVGCLDVKAGTLENLLMWSRNRRQDRPSIVLCA